MGEVFQSHTREVVLVCTHCHEEFEYFTEFSLHAQEHLEQLWQQSAVVVDEIDKSKVCEFDSNESQNQTVSSVGAISYGNSSVNWNNTESMEDGTSGNYMIIEFSSDESEADDCRDDGMDSDESTQIETRIETQAASTPKNTKSTGKSPPRQSLKQRILAYRKKGDYSVQHKRCIEEYEASTSKANALRKLNIFRMSIKEFSCYVEDTAESRMLASYVIKNVKIPMLVDQYVCPVCDIAFKDVHFLKKHILTHAEQPIFRCELCSQRFRSVQHFQTHFNSDHGSIKFEFECFLCHDPFPSYPSLQQHMNLAHSRQSYCDYCDIAFTRHVHYQTHMKAQHARGVKHKVAQTPTQHTPQISMYECFLCHKDFRKREQLRIHLRIHNRQAKLCLICGAQYRSATYFSHHMKLHEANGAKSHVCDICGKGFGIRVYMLRHRRKQHKLYLDGKQSTCEVCGITFDRRNELYEHMKSHPVDETRHHICALCNHPARTPAALKKHMAVHSTERPFECPICNKRYRQSSVSQHMRTHTNERPFACTVCGKRFSRRPHLQRHSSVHGGPNVPSHPCDLCDRTFKQTAKLLMHRRTHNVPLNYHCAFCNKGFLTLKTMQTHEASHIRQ